MLVVGALAAGSVYGVTAPATYQKSAKKKSAKKKSKRCKRSEVKRKLTYTKGRSRKRRRFTVCVPRSYLKQPASLAAGLRQGRRIVVKAAPKRIARLLRKRAARRVTAADRVTDRVFGARLGPVRAAAISHDGSGTQAVRGGPPGTQSVARYVATTWDSAEPSPGSELEVTTETRGRGSSKTTTDKLTRTMARCPDAGGVGRGVLKYSHKETQSVARPGGGSGVSGWETNFDAQVLVHFNDEAAVTSVEVVGDWTWEDVGGFVSVRGGPPDRLHSAGGRVTGTAAPNGSGAQITTTVTNASGNSSALWGTFFGVVASTLPEVAIKDLVSDSTSRARDGSCARIVPDPTTVHVKPGNSVAITARLDDGAGGARQGKVKASAQRATVTPGEAQAPAGFTYVALSSRPPGGTDTVGLSHVSKQGRASGKTVTVIYDPDFPASFSGTASGTMTLDTDEVHEVETFSANLNFERVGADSFHADYEIVGGSVSSTYSVDVEGGCQGSGSATWSWDPQAYGAMQLGNGTYEIDLDIGLSSGGQAAGTVTYTCPDPDENSTADYTTAFQCAGALQLLGSGVKPWTPGAAISGTNNDPTTTQGCSAQTHSFPWQWQLAPSG